MRLQISRYAGTALAAMASLALAAPAHTEDMERPLRLQAFAVDRNPGAGATAGPIEIVVERWTSEEDRTRLRQALEKSSDDLLRALQDTKKAGYIRAQGGGLGWTIQYARRDPLPDGGYRVIVATDRPMSFYERTTRPRSSDYEFLVADVRVAKDGQGEGKLVPAARINFDKGGNTIEIENYDQEPVQLTKVVDMDAPKDAGKARSKTDVPSQD